MGHDHEHHHHHEHAGQVEHGGDIPQEAQSAPGGVSPDLSRIAVLVNNWIDHNDGHRRTYLEWRDKLATAGLPTTIAALERVAALTDEATLELRKAAQELTQKQP